MDKEQEQLRLQAIEHAIELTNLLLTIRARQDNPYLRDVWTVAYLDGIRLTALIDFIEPINAELINLTEPTNEEVKH